MKKLKAINVRFPSTPSPIGAPSERVTEISVPGILKLEGGRRVRLDGIRCAEEAVGNLRRIMQGDTSSVVVLASGASATQPIPAEVWLVDRLSTSQAAYSNVAETAITSGWCNVETTSTSKQNERYAALAEAFQPSSAAR